MIIFNSTVGRSGGNDYNKSTVKMVVLRKLNSNSISSIHLHLTFGLKGNQHVFLINEIKYQRKHLTFEQDNYT